MKTKLFIVLATVVLAYLKVQCQTSWQIAGNSNITAILMEKKLTVKICLSQNNTNRCQAFKSARHLHLNRSISK
jgi:hypothetical protein